VLSCAVRKVLRYRLPKQVAGLRVDFQDKVQDAIGKPILSLYALRMPKTSYCESAPSRESDELQDKSIERFLQ
jgi:hypothetical protein